MNEHASPGLKQYIDTLSGQVMIGQDAYVCHIESGANPSSIITLGEALIDRSIPLDKTDTPLDVSDWQVQDFIDNGRFILDLLPESHKALNPIDTSVLSRGSLIGVTPTIKTISADKRFGNLANFNRALGVEPGLRRGEYDEWSEDQFIDYVGQITEVTPANISIASKINELSRKGCGPSAQVIRRCFGPLSVAINRAGFVDTTLWGEQDYLNWGLRFMRANDGRLPNTAAFKLLTPSRLAPNRSTINDHFMTLSAFQRQLKSLWTETKLYTDIEEGELPAELACNLPTSGLSLSRRASLYKLINTAAPKLLEDEKVSLALQDDDDSLEKVRRRIGLSLTLDHLREKAVEFGLSDYIWPDDTYLYRLRIDDFDRLSPHREVAPKRKVPELRRGIEALLEENSGLTTEEIFNRIFPDEYSYVSQQKIMLRLERLEGSRLKRSLMDDGKTLCWQLVTI